MSPLNPLFALVVLLLALAVTAVLQWKVKFSGEAGRFESIDGLRGFLAISVFIHHANIWYSYLQTGAWEAPVSNLFNQLGATGVTFFFMISSFLFVNRLLATRETGMNWKRFFVKRFYRLFPLHAILVVLIFLIILWQGNWELRDSITTLVLKFAKWLGFGVVGLDFVNGSNAYLVNAGVLWSLPYEWLLYFSLPLAALVFHKKRPAIWFVLAGVAFIIFSGTQVKYLPEHFISFAGGAIAPFVMRLNLSRFKVNHPLVSLVVLGAIASIFFFHGPNNAFCKALIILAFTGIALGNKVFGLLKWKVLKLLGEMSYSTYLIHGIVIFLAVHRVVGFERAKGLSEAEFGLFVFALVPVVVGVSYLAYRWIEKPFMERARRKYQ